MGAVGWEQRKQLGGEYTSSECWSVPKDHDVSVVVVAQSSSYIEESRPRKRGSDVAGQALVSCGCIACDRALSSQLHVHVHVQVHYITCIHMNSVYYGKGRMHIRVHVHVVVGLTQVCDRG